MDVVVHRTKKFAKRTFPWGDLIIWLSGILALVVFFRIIRPLSNFLYGVVGVYVFTIFIFTIIWGICVKTGKRLKIDIQYLLGSIIMILTLFIALHVGFTASEMNTSNGTSLGRYLSYCYRNAPTPGGVIFGLPAYLLMVISGRVGSFLLLGVFFIIGLVLVTNCALLKRTENRIVVFQNKKVENEPSAVDYESTTSVLYEKLQTTHKELVRESRKRFDAKKSLLGLGTLPKENPATVTAGEPVPLATLQTQTPEDINQESLAAAEQLMGNLKMYNDGKVIPWQAQDSTAWSTVNPVVPPVTPLNTQFTNPLTNPQPTMPAAPQTYPQNTFQPKPNTWEQPANLGWNGNVTWTPPAPEANLNNNFSGNNDVNNGGMAIRPSLERRKNSRVLKNIENQTFMPLDTPEPQTNTFKNKRYIKPTLDLIHTESMDLSQFNAEASEKENMLNELFKQYNVKARVRSFNVAPAVTRFEIIPEMGTRVSQIENLRDDINFTLKTNNTRMESPIEGKNAIGIEVPNRTIGTVSIRDLLGAREFLLHPSPLAICVGKDINDEPVIADLAEMPHLLVAGTTGSGKSVCINTILTSLIYKTGPEDLKLMLIDMKGGVELGVYNGLPHMLVERCISNPTQVVNAMKWLINEMNHRYDLLQGQRVNSIALYQALPAYKNGQIPAMPYIVMVIDEVADLMLRNKKEVEDCIQNLAQKSRAAGIHIILATQRPSVNVISGVIKANIGTRIAFRVLNGVDSKVILDQIGAETLMGRGDMLFMTAKGIERVQGCYLTNDESHKIVAAVREKNKAEFDLELEDLILNGMPDGSAASFDDDGGGGEQDPKFVQVLRYAVRENNVRQTLSISEIQRKFSVGFGRAGKIIDQLERAGFISADFGNGKPREVLASREQVAELYGL